MVDFLNKARGLLPPVLPLWPLTLVFPFQVPSGSGKQPSPAQALVAQLRERAALLQERRREPVTGGTTGEASAEVWSVLSLLALLSLPCLLQLYGESLRLLCSGWEQLARGGPSLPEAALAEISQLCERMQQFVQAARTPPTPHQPL